MKTLAAAYAEVGKFPEAIAAIQKADALAASAGQSALRAECKKMLETFQSGQPWRAER
jgi:hypothetical protein